MPFYLLFPKRLTPLGHPSVHPCRPISLSYQVTEAFSIGIGGRYWAMWTMDVYQVDQPSKHRPPDYRALRRLPASSIQIPLINVGDAGRAQRLVTTPASRSRLDRAGHWLSAPQLGTNMTFAGGCPEGRRRICGLRSSKPAPFLVLLKLWGGLASRARCGGRKACCCRCG
jgi:hypothetical protein